MTAQTTKPCKGTIDEAHDMAFPKNTRPHARFTKEKDSAGRFIIWNGERLVAVVYSGEADADLIVEASHAKR